MQKLLTQKKIKHLSLLLLCSTSLLNCTKDNELINDSLNGTNFSFATPIDGNIYSINNVGNGRTLDIEDASNSNGANLQLQGKDANKANTHRQWEIIATDNGYVRLKGVDSGKTLEVAEGSNSTGANVQQWAYQGTTHQQWEIISTGNGNFRLKNRDSGKSLRANGSINGSNVDQAAYIGDNTQQWYFTEIVSGNGDNEITNPVFIDTNDGTFNLNDFQIESSSHLSNILRTTTSWNYNSNNLLGTEWYFISGNDYYLKCANSNGKRTEFKEDEGKESSLYTNKVLKYEASIDEIPENGVTIAQVHNRQGGVNRPYLRVYIEDGKIKVKETINPLTNSSGSYSTVTGPSYSENSKLKVQITTSNGSVNVKVETTSGTLNEDFTPSGDSKYENDYYLKAGVYTEGNNTQPIIRFYSIEN